MPFVDMPIDNPYGNRKPITDPSRFYGRHDEILLLMQKIRSGQICALSGEPRIGKTSLLAYFVHPQGAKALPEFMHYLGNPDKYLFVLIELARLPTQTSRGFFRYLFERLREEAEKSTTAQAEAEHIGEHGHRMSDDYDYEAQRAFEHYLKKLEKHVILLFDDFDVVFNTCEKSDVATIMQRLRALAQAVDLQERLNYIFVSVDPLEQLLKTSSFASASPLSIIITDYEVLRPLREEDLEEFINGPLQEPRFTSGDIVFIKQLAGQHPVLVKAACFHLFEARYRKKALLAPRQLRQIIEKDPAVQGLMQTLWQRVEEAKVQDGLVQVAQSGTSAQTKALEWLEKRGLIDRSANDPWILGSMFRAFVERKYHEAQVTRIASSPEPQNSQGDNLQNFRGHMTRLERKLYSYLVEHAGQTCTRPELEKAIWGDALPASRDALEQLIRRVREKIEPHPGYPEYLLTMRGLGYLLRGGSRV